MEKDRTSSCRLSLSAVAVLSVAAAFSPGVCAQGADIIHIITPFPPGGQGDSVARLVATELGKRMKKTAVVENKPGANTIIAAQLLAKAPADGSYLMVTSDATLVTNPSLYVNLPYKPTDFTPVSLIVDLPLALVASMTTQPNNVKEVISAARAAPNKFSYASIGVGSTQQLGMELFASMAQIKLNHIPYKGGSSAINDLAGGHVNYFLAGVGTASTFLKSGKVKVIGLTGKERSAALPNVPTIAESGLPGFHMSAWLGVIAPAALPPKLTEEIQGHLAEMARAPELQEQWRALGAIPIGSSSAQFRAFLQKDAIMWKNIITQTGIKGE